MLRSNAKSLAGICALALVLASCGGDDDAEPAEGADETADTTATDTTPAETEDTTATDTTSAETEDTATSDTTDVAETGDSDALAALVEEAKAEGGALNLNWGYPPFPDIIDELETGFNERFGLEVDVSYTPEVSMPANFGVLADEVSADRPASSDAFIASYPFAIQGGPNGADMFASIDWDALAPEWPEGVASDDGIAVTFLHQIFGFAYNTNEFSADELPTTVDEVVAFASEHPVASTPYAAGFNNLAPDDLLGRDGTLAHVTAVGEAATGLIGCADVDRIASGEFVGFWMNCGSNLIDMARETRGAPVDSVVLADAAVTQPWTISIPKNSEHPKTATLWTYYLLTDEAQDLVYEHGFADNRLLEGSHTAEEIAEIEAGGIEFVHQGYEYGLENPVITDNEFNGQLIGALTGQSG